MIRVLFICHGNICRSTMAESVFTHKVKTLGLSDQFLIDSFATSTEEIGNPPHRGTVNKLREVGIPLVPHRAKQITWADYEKADYIIGMDSANMRNLNRMLKNDPEEKLYKFLTLPDQDGILRILGIQEILMKLMKIYRKVVRDFWIIWRNMEKSITDISE